MKSEFKNILLYDIRNAIRINGPKLLPLIMVCVAMSIYYNSQINYYNVFENANIQVGFMDYYLYAMAGMEEYVEETKEAFRISYGWLFINFYLAYIIGGYAYSDILGMGKQLIIRMRNKFFWIVGKIAYVAVSVLLFYMMLVLSFLVLTIILNGGVETLGQGLVLMEELDISVFPSKEYLLMAAFVLPICTSFVISVAQMILSVFTKPIYSYVMVIIYMIASAYWNHWSLLGNNSMLLRNEYVTLNGVKCVQALMIEGIFLLLIIICGNVFIKRKDILRTDEEK